MLRFVRLGLLSVCVSSLTVALSLGSASLNNLSTFRGGAACSYGALTTLACVDATVCNRATAPACKTLINDSCNPACTGSGDKTVLQSGGLAWNETGTSDCGFEYTTDPVCQKKTNPDGSAYCGCATGGQASTKKCAYLTYAKGCGASTSPKTSPTK